MLKDAKVDIEFIISGNFCFVKISVEHGSLISRESIDNGSWIFAVGILQDIFLPPSNRICSDDSLNHSNLLETFDYIQK